MRTFILPAFCALLLMPLVSKSQNFYNVYDPNADFTGMHVEHDYPLSQFNRYHQLDPFKGEYSIDAHELKNYFSLGGLDIKVDVKVELVSFPFAPDKFAYSTGDTERKLTLPKPSDKINNGWKLHGIDELHNSIEQIDIQPNFQFVGLASFLFKNNAYAEAESAMIPHSILNHTITLRCEYGIIAKFSIVADHTRGRMSYYPFMAQNGTGNSDTKFYDIAIIPTFLHGDLFGVDHTYLTDSNEDWWYKGKSTLNYFPESENSTLGNDDSYELLGDNKFESIRYIMAPYILPGLLIGNERANCPAGYEINANTKTVYKMPGIQHQYIIDQNVDLSAINSDQQVIYNPSRATVTADNLIFPTGYEFRTARSVYPSAEELEQNNPEGLEDLRKIYAKSDQKKWSMYILEKGSQLTIEPCVGLFDVFIYVKDGAKLRYNPDFTYGNYHIIDADPANGNIELTPSPVKYISKQPASLSKPHNCPASFSIEFYNASYVDYYDWQKLQGSEWVSVQKGDSPQYTIASVSGSGTYRCVVRDECGTNHTSQNAYLNALPFSCPPKKGNYFVRSAESDFNQTSELVVYPNPSTDGNFLLKSQNDIQSIEIYSIFGKLVHQQDVNTEEIQMDLSLPSGIYLLNCILPDGRKLNKRLEVL